MKKHISESLVSKAKEKMKESYKENPAFAAIKMKPKVSNLPKAKGKDQKAMAAQGLA